MKYSGKLYGKVGKRYIPLILTSEEVDAMQNQIKELQEKLAESKNGEPWQCPLCDHLDQCECPPGTYDW